MGFPLVKVKREGGLVCAEQTRFLLSPEARNPNSTIASEPKSQYDYKWYIPLSYYTDVSDEEMVWMNLTDG